jgi:hypothetical protein
VVVDLLIRVAVVVVALVVAVVQVLPDQPILAVVVALEQAVVVMVDLADQEL